MRSRSVDLPVLPPIYHGISPSIASNERIRSPFEASLRPAHELTARSLFAPRGHEGASDRGNNSPVLSSSRTRENTDLLGQSVSGQSMSRLYRRRAGRQELSCPARPGVFFFFFFFLPPLTSWRPCRGGQSQIIQSVKARGYRYRASLPGDPFQGCPVNVERSCNILANSGAPSIPLTTFACDHDEPASCRGINKMDGGREGGREEAPNTVKLPCKN